MKYTFTACNLASSKYPWRSSLSFRSWSGSVTWSRISVVRLTFSSDGKASSIFCITWGWCGKTIVESTWVIYIEILLAETMCRKILQYRLLYTFYGASCSELRQHSKLISQSSLSSPSMIRQATRQPNLCWDSSITWSAGRVLQILIVDSCTLQVPYPGAMLQVDCTAGMASFCSRLKAWLHENYSTRETLLTSKKDNGSWKYPEICSSMHWMNCVFGVVCGQISSIASVYVQLYSSPVISPAKRNTEAHGPWPLSTWPDDSPDLQFRAAFAPQSFRIDHKTTSPGDRSIRLAQESTNIVWIVMKSPSWKVLISI